MKRFLSVAILVIIVAAMCTIIVTSCQSSSEVVSGIVTDKKEQREMYFNAGFKMWLPTNNTNYLVTITCEQCSTTFDNQSLYETVQEGDTIQVILRKTYIGNLLLSKTLQLIEAE